MIDSRLVCLPPRPRPAPFLSADSPGPATASGRKTVSETVAEKARVLARPSLLSGPYHPGNVSGSWSLRRWQRSPQRPPLSQPPRGTRTTGLGRVRATGAPTPPPPPPPQLGLSHIPRQLGKMDEPVPARAPEQGSSCHHGLHVPGWKGPESIVEPDTGSGPYFPYFQAVGDRVFCLGVSLLF